MPKTQLLGVRVEPAVKAAIERAARDDERSASAMVDRILRAWLIEHGYLKKS